MARRFRRLRSKLNLSQTAFARLIGLSRCAVTLIENAKTYPIYSTRQRFELVEFRHSGVHGAGRDDRTEHSGLP